MTELITKALADLHEALTDNATRQDYDRGICMATVTATDETTEVYIDATAYFTAPQLMESQTYDRPALWSHMELSEIVITDAVAIVDNIEYDIKHLIQ
jgi:hypothetical protein